MKKYHLIRSTITSIFPSIAQKQFPAYLSSRLEAPYAGRLLINSFYILKISLFLILFMLSALGCSDSQRTFGKVFQDISFELPRPSGPFGVHRSKFEIKEDKKSLVLFIYQPAVDSLGQAFTFAENELREAYLPVLQKRLGDRGGYAASFSKMTFARKLQSITQKFPVIFFSPGMNWTSLDYSYLIQELVSRGNILIGINPEALSTLFYDPSIPALKKSMSLDERVVQTTHSIRTAASFTLKNLAAMGLRNADIEKVAFLGHSLGGASSLLTAMDFPGLKAAINLDGDLLESSKEAQPACPILFICQFPDEDFRSSSPMLEALKGEDWRYENMSRASRKASNAYFVGMNGLAHSDFLDAGLIPRTMIPPGIASDKFGRLNPQLALDLVAKNILLFLKASFDKDFGVFETKIQKGLKQRIFNLKTGILISQ